MSSPADLLVLGAGPAGLAAAWRAARRGLAVTVLERGEAIGGLAGSFEVAGIRVDHGSHRLHPATPPSVLADLRLLLGDDLQTRRRNGRLRFAGRWVAFPPRGGNLARTLPPALLARLAAEAATGPVRRANTHTGTSIGTSIDTSTDTYAGVLRRGLGPTLYDNLYGPYARKLWGLPGEGISAEQARRRVSSDTAGKLASRVLRARRGNGQGRAFYYPRRGYGQIVEALADAAAAEGARILPRTAVERVDLGERSVRAHVGGDQTYEAAHAFSTIPLPLLAEMADPAPPADAVEAARDLRFRAMVLVYVVHEGGRWTSYDAHYLPCPETPVTRVCEPANYRDSSADPTDRSVLCFEIPCAVGDDVWRADERTLGALAEDALAVTGLPPVRTAEVVVRRLPRVYPVYELGHEQRLDGLDRWARSLERLTTFGRLGLFAHDNTHHAIVMAYDAADALGTGRFDHAAWSAARARFADHVVED